MPEDNGFTKCASCEFEEACMKAGACTLTAASTKAARVRKRKSMAQHYKLSAAGVSLRIGRLVYKDPDPHGWVAPLGPDGQQLMQIQAVQFDKASWDLLDAMDWLEQNKLWPYGFTLSSNSLIFPLRNELDFDSSSLQVISTIKEDASVSERMSRVLDLARVLDATPAIIAEPAEYHRRGALLTAALGLPNKPNDDEVVVYHEDERSYSLADEPEALHKISGIEIFRAGTWNKDEYDIADLDDMVANFDEVGFKPPVKLGHTDDTGGRAWGWIDRIYRKGDKLLADFIDIPASLFKQIKERAFDTVSSEIFWNLERNGKKFKRVLKAVALLGAETPAVSDLAPLRTVVNQLQDLHAEGVHGYKFNPEEWTDMTKIAELEAQVADLSTKLAAANAESAEAKQLKADLDKARSEYVAELKAAAAKTSELEQQINGLTSKLAEMADKDRLTRVAAKANECKIPALRPALLALYDLASTSSRKLNYALDPAKAAEEVSPEVVLADLVAALNKAAAKLFDERGRAPEPADRDVPAGEDVQVEIERAAREHMEKTGTKKFADAVKAVLASNAELRARYAAETRH